VGRLCFRAGTFFWLIVLLVAVSRAAVILTSHDDAQIDLSIYQEVGQLVVNGVDPYDFAKDRGRRTELRMDGHGVGDWAKTEEAAYDFYVAGNLPGSSAFYGLIEWATQGNLRLWRLGLGLGDIGIAAAAFFLMRQCGARLDNGYDQRLFALGTVFYPSLVYWGLIRAEDKQFETALLLLSAALLVREPRFAKVSAALIGLVFSASILFKALGLFLTPLAASYFRRRPWQEAAVAVLAAALPALWLCTLFDRAFLELIYARVMVGTVAAGAALHASPWQLFPQAVFELARPVLTIGLAALLLAGYLRGRIDLLNLCAGGMLIAICVATVNGSMDRMNMAMIFALFSVASLSLQSWRALVTFNVSVQVPLYAAVIARVGWFSFVNLETPDAIATLLFVASYFWVVGPLAIGLRRSAADSQGAAAAARAT
jgi:hypothetical protein